MDKTGNKRKLDKRKILFLAAAIVIALLLISGRLTPAELVNGIVEAEQPTAQETPIPDIKQTEADTPEQVQAEPDVALEESSEPKTEIDKDGSYTSKEDVALYIHTYGCLPSNFITKSEAKKLGWSGGSLEGYAPGCSIGGDRFGNYEGLLPEGRIYTECDIDTAGASSRGAKRIVFSNDGLIYYTDDHYESFELLYGEE